MLVSFGRRQTEDTVMRMLADCHQRMRTHVQALAGPFVTPTHLAAALAYFTQAFNLHAEDEEQRVVPRLLAQGLGLDLLPVMQAQHAALAAPVTRLLAALHGASAQGRTAALAATVDTVTAPSIADAASALLPILESHLQWEEATFFPLVARLSAAVQLACLAEMRAQRRGVAPQP